MASSLTYIYVEGDDSREALSGVPISKLMSDVSFVCVMRILRHLLTDYDDFFLLEGVYLGSGPIYIRRKCSTSKRIKLGAEADCIGLSPLFINQKQLHSYFDQRRQRCTGHPDT